MSEVSGEARPSIAPDLSTKTVKQLKEELLARGLSTNGVKAVLIARLGEAMQGEAFTSDQKTEAQLEGVADAVAAPEPQRQEAQEQETEAPADNQAVQEPVETQIEGEELELAPNEVAQALGNPHLAELIHRSQDPASWTDASSLPSPLGSTKPVLSTRYCRFCRRWVESPKVRSHGSTSSHLEQVLASEKSELLDIDSFKEKLVKAWVGLLGESDVQALDSASPQTILTAAVSIILISQVTNGIFPSGICFFCWDSTHSSADCLWPSIAQDRRLALIPSQAIAQTSMWGGWLSETLTRLHSADVTWEAMFVKPFAQWNPIGPSSLRLRLDLLFPTPSILAKNLDSINPINDHWFQPEDKTVYSGEVPLTQENIEEEAAGVEAKIEKTVEELGELYGIIDFCEANLLRAWKSTKLYTIYKQGLVVGLRAVEAAKEQLESGGSTLISEVEIPGLAASALPRPAYWSGLLYAQEHNVAEKSGRMDKKRKPGQYQNRRSPPRTNRPELGPLPPRIQFERRSRSRSPPPRGHYQPLSSRDTSPTRDRRVSRYSPERHRPDYDRYYERYPPQPRESRESRELDRYADYGKAREGSSFFQAGTSHLSPQTPAARVAVQPTTYYVPVTYASPAPYQPQPQPPPAAYPPQAYRPPEYYAQQPQYPQYSNAQYPGSQYPSQNQYGYY